MNKHFDNIMVIREKKHRFLRMNLTINKGKNIEIEIEMRDQLQEVIDVFSTSEGEEINEEVSSPAQKHLRDGNNNC